VDPDTDPYWPAEYHADPAVYVHRLTVGRAYAGTGLGAALLDWAGRCDPGARWLRLSAWTDNERLHAYYQRQGFTLCVLRADDSYPSSAFFQRPAGAENPYFKRDGSPQ
jgi:ribosomal protein S18 acetylase RimI-like enzyme